jgi:hypothetical protein
MFHQVALPDVVPDFLAVAGFAVDRMMSSRAGNRNMLSFAPHLHGYRTILTAPQQKSNGRALHTPLRFNYACVTESS